MLPIILLIVTGMLLYITEVFLPGGIIGFFGIVALVIGTFLAFKNYGAAVGLLVLAVSIGIVAGCLYFAYNILPKTAIGKRLYLQTSLKKAKAPQHDNLDITALIGKEGCCKSNLRPVGIALIDGKRVNVVSRSEFISKNTVVCVIDIADNRIVVEPVKKK